VIEASSFLLAIEKLESAVIIEALLCAYYCMATHFTIHYYTVYEQLIPIAMHIANYAASITIQQIFSTHS
jgi:hypothetical protein